MEPYFSLLLPLFQRVQKGEAAFIVSAITEAELLVRPYRDGNAAAVERVGDLLSENGIYVAGVDRRIGRRAAQLRAGSYTNGKRLALADAIIIATAIETECEAIVGNDGEWRRLNDIRFVCLDDLAAAV